MFDRQFDTNVKGVYFTIQKALPLMPKGILSQVLLGRFGNPEEVASVVLFLSSDEAAFVHGTSIHVDGGMASL